MFVQAASYSRLLIPRKTFSDWVNLTRLHDATEARVETATHSYGFGFLNHKLKVTVTQPLSNVATFSILEGKDDRRVKVYS